MAVVFISPKKRQKMFFVGITAAFALFIVFVSLMVFLSGPKSVSQELVFNKPKVNINMEFLDSEQFENLQVFPEMEIQYRYKAYAKDKTLKTGFITGTSLVQVRKTLESRGLSIAEVKEAESGRENPFTPYYETTPALTTAEATKE